ncbi:MAG: amidohydrolase [Candidatus Micrarchaeota archaeon]|nr:amidohydrolase [Candidatus Micrarchaeota archaeon]
MLLIKNGTLVDAFGTIRADILIENGHIIDVKKGISEKADEGIDASGKIIVPGFVNMHNHLPMSLLRNNAEGKTLGKWLNEDIFPAERRMDEEDMYLGSYIGMAESLSAGITTTNSVYLEKSHLGGKAADELNARAFLSCDEPKEDGEEELKSALKFNERIRGYRMARPVMASHSVYSCKKENLILKKEYAKQNSLRYHIHMSETRKEIFHSIRNFRMRPVEYAESIGLLDKNTILAHAGWVTKREIGIIAKKKSVVVNNPVSNLKLATGGIMPLEQYREAGARITLGTDGPASNNSINMLETMKFSSLMQKHRYWNASLGNPKEILGYATYEGAKALGLKAGKLEKGYLADLAIIDPKINMVPLGDIYTSLVFSCNNSNIDTVIVDGKISFENGKVRNFDGKKARMFLERADALISGSS